MVKSQGDGLCLCRQHRKGRKGDQGGQDAATQAGGAYMNIYKGKTR